MSFNRRSPLPKHQLISESLREQIAAGKFAASRRLPSETALARRFGVSRPTAARALRDLQAEGLVERRVGAGTFVREPEPASATRSLTVGLYAPGLGDTEVLEPICNEIMRAGQEQSMRLIWPEEENAKPNPWHAEAACRRLIEQGVAGVFFAPHERLPERETLNRRVAEQFRAAGVAVVLLDRDVFEFPGRSDFDLVSIDHFQAAFTLAEHLIELGRHRFCFIAKPGYPGTTDLRMAGCREAIARKGIPLKRDWARFGDPTDASFVRRIFKPAPDVIMCANDLTAALLIQTLARLDIQPPPNASIVGFDDVKYATLLSVPLTTIRQPCADLARIAVDVLRARIADPGLPPRQVLLKGELIVRKSSGAPA